MSKRTDRIAAAKARSPEEIAALRKRERSRQPSEAATWVTGKNKGKRVVDLMKIRLEKDAS